MKNVDPTLGFISLFVKKPRKISCKNFGYKKNFMPECVNGTFDDLGKFVIIDSGSSIVGGGIRENTIPEALYSTVQETVPSSLSIVNGETQANTLNRGTQVVYAIPSMTSPPPTYDVAIAKNCQVILIID